MTERKNALQKVTLSLPKELVRYADARATELATSRSQVFGGALAELRARDAAELAREGYAFFAAESAAFAAASMAAVSEAIGHAG